MFRKLVKAWQIGNSLNWKDSRNLAKYLNHYKEDADGAHSSAASGKSPLDW